MSHVGERANAVGGEEVRGEHRVEEADERPQMGLLGMF